MVAVVVPVYRQTLTDLERISYRQLINVLGTFEIIIAAPEHLEMPKEIKGEKIRVEYFAKDFFQSVDSYSQLMLSKVFYRRFIRYQYILIYQLDAFVFRNELMHFCSMGYDYIGAPWISGFCEYTNLKRKVLYVGNGGFSLRKVEACLDVLERRQDLLNLYQGRNEDAFYSACGGEDFKVAPREVALAFSFEREVRLCFEENHKILPFGCHAWERYDLGFWREYIEKFGYELDMQAINDGADDQHNKAEYLWMKKNTALMENDRLFYEIPSKVRKLFQSNKEESYYLWGAGYVGRYACSLFSDLGMKILGFVDTDVNRQGTYINEFMVYNPKFLEKQSKVIVSVNWLYNSDVEKVLNSLGFTYLQQYIFFEDILPEVGEHAGFDYYGVPECCKNN